MEKWWEKKRSLNIKKRFFWGGGRPDPECSAAILAEHQRYRHRQHITVRPSGILLLQPRRSAPLLHVWNLSFLQWCWLLVNGFAFLFASFLTELLPGLLCLRRLNYHQIFAFHQPTAEKVFPEAGKLVQSRSKTPLGRIQASPYITIQYAGCVLDCCLCTWKGGGGGGDLHCLSEKCSLEIRVWSVHMNQFGLTHQTARAVSKGAGERLK